ncbi:MAG: hypothetical protein BGO12_14400 [Verrucomicrobia bacterium 61-8]|nr:MAG: hypothetical protein BGO12_14400 [Verrucomicrobia bacterium 61-8]
MDILRKAGIVATVAAMLGFGNSLPAQTVIFQIGTFDNSLAEFEQEGNNRNNAQFYVDAGNYSGNLGKSTWNAGNGAGYGATSATAEPLQQGQISAGGATIGSDPTNTLGFPRSLNGLDSANVLGRQVIDIFFQASSLELAEPYLSFSTSFISLGTGSSHNIEFYLNGVLFGSISNMTTAQTYSVTFASDDLLLGSNVLSIVRTDPVVATGQPWVGLDAVNLTAVPEPSSILLLGVGMLWLVAGRKNRKPQAVKH